MSEIENKTANTTNEIGIPGVYCSLIANKGYKVQPLKNIDDNEAILINSENLFEIATLLKMHKEAQFSLLYSVTGTDYSDKFELVYHLYSVKLNKKVILKAYIDRNNPEINSLAQIFSTANWHERETYDLLGITFTNHPDLRRILLPDDWIGHPLRKDYVMKDERLIWNAR